MVSICYCWLSKRSNHQTLFLVKLEIRDSLSFLDNLNHYCHIYQLLKKKSTDENLSTDCLDGIGSFTADILSNGLESGSIKNCL